MFIAALDASCLIDIYNVISEECIRQGMSLECIINEMRNPSRSPKKAKEPEDPPAPRSLKVAEVNVICTRELFLLLKRLRRCGIDAHYCDSVYPSKVSLERGLASKQRAKDFSLLFIVCSDIC